MPDIHKDNENPPLHPSLTLIKFKTIRKTEKWWSVVIRYSAYGGERIALYLYINRDGSWVRKQKYTISNASSDDLIKDLLKAIQSLI